jgi:hypothetical protein
MHSARTAVSGKYHGGSGHTARTLFVLRFVAGPPKGGLNAKHQKADQNSNYWI